MLLPLLFASLACASGPGSIDAKAAANLIKRCEEMKSWSLVVLHDGKEVINRNFGHVGACNLMSATKSITGLAIGFLLDEGKLSSVNATVASVLPEYQGDLKDKVTILHLLTQSSGIAPYNDPKEDLTNRVPAAIKAPVTTDPGKVFFYNNRAVDLLSGIVRKLAGEPMDDYVNRKLFKPLGIKEYAWMKDPDGNPHGCAELVLRPRDLAKIGQLMLNEGVWEGKRLLSTDFIAKATHQSESAQPYPDYYGWLWWISYPWMTMSQRSVESLGGYGVKPASLKKLQPLVNQRWPSVALMWSEVLATAEPDPALATVSAHEIQAIAKDAGDPDGFYAAGWGGQYLFVLPKEKIVAVRTIGSGFFSKTNPDNETKEEFYRYAKLQMPDFYRLVKALVPSRK